ncbi:MAG TPA: hypothetical protein VGW97_00100 [Chthoniobacterales bacterium]|jgi:hypothetical protein|nr:hypothetical protein [Chthoniobacterales bacterium]
MAKKSGSKPTAELREEIERSREAVERRLIRVREEADLPRKIRRSVRREPVPWIVGAIAFALLVTAIVTRKRKVYVTPKGTGKAGSSLLEAGFLLGVTRIAANLIKPVVVSFIEKQLGSYASRGRSDKKGS